MTWRARAFAGALLSIVTVVSAALHADTVQITIRGGRISLVATNATPAQIFAAWSRAGGVLIVNVERMPSAPLTLRLDNVPEEQALDTLLRSVSGYLAQRRPEPAESASIFNRIVILPTPQVVRQTAPAAAASTAGPPVPLPRPTVQPQPPLQNQQQAIPQGPGVTRLIGADGQPVEDDQAGAPPPPYNPGDSPDPRPPIGAPRGVPIPVPVPMQRQQPPQQSLPPQSTSAPAGAPRPGMVVPAVPQDPQQLQPQQQQQQQQPQR